MKPTGPTALFVPPIAYCITFDATIAAVFVMSTNGLPVPMPPRVMVSTDIGNINSVANSYLRFEEPRSFFAPMSFGNCGYAFPTMIGAKVAAPDRPAISYAGDGAWGMSMGEIMTCVRHDIPVTAVVFHNRQWGAEKKNQVDFYNRRFVAGELENQSFAGIAKAMGATVIACASSEDKLAVCREHGADEAINYKTKDFVDEVRALTGKRGVDVVVEHIGGETFERSVQALTRLGTLVSIGSHDTHWARMDLRHVYSKNLRVLGTNLGSILELGTILDHLADGRLKPVIDRVFPLADARAAVEALAPHLA